MMNCLKLQFTYKHCHQHVVYNVHDCTNVVNCGVSNENHSSLKGKPKQQSVYKFQRKPSQEYLKSHG